MGNSNLEIERRFILRTSPSAPATRTLQIFQKYAADGWRYRQQHDGIETRYFKTRKTSLGKGINHEEESEISAADFIHNSGDIIKGIAKTRAVYTHNNLHFEVDIFHHLTLVIMEVELTDIDQPLDIPDHLKELIIYEITGISQFSNSALALPAYLNVQTP